MSSKSTFDVLTDNLREIDLGQTSMENMEGDIPQLRVKNVFVGNVRIGWPYPSEWKSSLVTVTLSIMTIISNLILTYLKSRASKLNE